MRLSKRDEKLCLTILDDLQIEVNKIKNPLGISELDETPTKGIAVSFGKIHAYARTIRDILKGRIW